MRAMGKYLICALAAVALVTGSVARAIAAPAQPPRTVSSVASLQCPSPTLCVGLGIGGPNLVTSRQPRGSTAAWKAETVDGGRRLKLLACAPTHWCLLVDQNDRVLISRDPARGAASWRLSPGGRAGHLDNVSALSCPSSRLCVGVAGHYVVSSTNPARGGAAWRQALVNNHAPADAIDCPTTTLCVTAGADGQVAVSRDPTARTSWHHSTLQPQRPAAGDASVSCASAAECVVGQPGGRVFSTADVGSGRITWEATRLAPSQLASAPSSSARPSPAPLVACTPANVCAVASNGAVWTSPAPRPGGRRRWRRVAKAQTPLISIACAPRALCVATDAAGHALSAGNVMRAAAWRQRTIGRPLTPTT